MEELIDTFILLNLTAGLEARDEFYIQLRETYPDPGLLVRMIKNASLN
jgi:hypothetical protein